MALDSQDGMSFARHPSPITSHVEATTPEKGQYTIKGIEKETLDLMRSAARKDGMKVGAWVSARIQEAAHRSLHGDNSVAPERLQEQIERIEEIQREDSRTLQTIQEELLELVRFQRTIAVKLLEQT